jgi:regulator of RNase E activity RraA
MKEWKDDKTLFRLIREELYTAVVGDIMDKMGYTRQFLPPRIRPLREDMTLAGRAMTVLEADVPAYGNNAAARTAAQATEAQAAQEAQVREASAAQAAQAREASATQATSATQASANGGANPLLKRPFGLMLEALDDLKEDEVYVCSGASPAYALWGELMSARAICCKAAGAVVNGYSRDTKGIQALNFPCFSYGPYAQDQAPRGKVIDFRVPIEMDGVVICDGDIVIGDIDGVCVVPRRIEDEVFTLALEKARGERMVLKKIQQGMKARDAFDKYGIM